MKQSYLLQKNKLTKHLKSGLFYLSLTTTAVTLVNTNALATTFDFNNGTSQGWRRIGFYDNGGLTPIPGFFTDDPATFFDGQNSPGSPPAFDPLGDGVGSTGVGTGGFITPASPTGDAFIHWDLNSPDLSSDLQWQNISKFTYDVTGGGMFSPNGVNFVQAVLRVELPNGTNTFFSDGVFNPITISQPYGQSSWTTYTVDVSAFSIPTGSILQGVDFRTFFTPQEGYDGFIGFDNVTPMSDEPTTTPEPGTILGLLAIGGLGLSIKRKQQQA